MTSDGRRPQRQLELPHLREVRRGRIKELPDHCKALGLKRPLLITDPAWPDCR